MSALCDLTCDDFLGGRLSIWQPRDGYRAGVDPVLLAASVPARAGQSVLELGCGVGTASLCLGWRVAGLRLSGLELQADYADLARKNADHNGIKMDVVTGDLAQMPDVLRQQSFDHVIANPPYFLQSARSAAQDEGREIALAGETPLTLWFDAAIRRLNSKGQLTVIQRMERLPEMLSSLDSRVGSITVQPLGGRPGRPAKLVLMSAIKGSRAAFRLLEPIQMHTGVRHEGDSNDYPPAIDAVMRHGSPLVWTK
ncbi:tRNA1(Val) (adenine(37)-N6)-methyltransferase [Rhodovulum sp. FJ3]|uniref:tRNA1(Val) (adenine(37)-N6)-methyltransferase n=1 Tax=Rhodovulum sp. FJ3 TaxID=3079053 RepID=UPI00293DB9FF|nr:methyltransferase [Rhodovulum sp. FJ3]MDV4169502.1 methyltransferase [Rhodovulum sp. FJ3]